MYSNTSDGMTLGYALGRDSNDNRNDGMWGDGFGMWAWIILIALFGGFGNGWGWGGNGFGGANGNAQFTDAAVQRGFDTQAIIGKLDGINENRFANQQCCCNIERAIDNSRFDTQTGFNAIGQQISSCCCDIRSGLKDIQFQNATDTCALQTTMLNNTRDIIDNQNAGVRSILDYLCQEKIADLQQENQTLRLAASQQAQNTYLIDQLRPAPVPAYPACPIGGYGYGYGAYGFNGYNGFGYNNNGCGCGCNNGCGCN